jgi:hypothetical protein
MLEAPVPAIVVRIADGFIVSSGVSDTQRQLDALVNGCPSGHFSVVGVEAPNGGYYRNGKVEPIPPPPVTIADVKREAGRLLKYTDWYVTRAADPADGTPIPNAVIAERQAIRDGAHRLEAMVPIPPDYRDPKYWS